MSEPTQLSHSLWINSSTLFTYHSGIFVNDRDVVLIDPGLSEPEINVLAQFIQDRDWNVETIILTHGHWDHVLGADAFPDPDLMTHKSFRTSPRNNEKAIRRIIANTPDLARTKPFEMPEPSEVVDKVSWLKIGDWKLDLVHTPGHAPDHLFIREPATGTVWTADMLSDEEIPFVIDSLGDYMRTMERIKSDDFRMLVACHGTPTSDPVEIRARIENDRSYIAELLGRVKNAVKAGQTVEETAAVCADIHYRQPVESNQGAHRRNVESAYAELGGDADAKKVGWLESWNELIK